MWWSRDWEWESGGGGGSVESDSSSGCDSVKLASLTKAVALELSTEKAAVGVTVSRLGVGVMRLWWMELVDPRA